MIVLTHIVGSKLHRLDNPDSDTDTMTVKMSPLIEMLSPFRSQDGKVQEDHVVYELKHFCSLLSKGNPTVLEVLFSDLKLDSSDIGNDLIANRHKFMSRQAIYHSYRGYAAGQRKRAEKSQDHKRIGKAAAAYMRVLSQGTDLLRNYEMDPSDVGYRDLQLQWKSGATYKETFVAQEGLFHKLENDLTAAYNDSCIDETIDFEWIERFILNSYLTTIGDRVIIEPDVGV